MKRVLAKHGQGIGDFFTYSGWVKQLAKENDVVYLNVQLSHYVDNVRQLYKDTPNVKINHANIGNVRVEMLSNSPVHYTGLVNCPNQFDFSLERDIESETKFYNKVTEKIGKDYILIHYRKQDNMGRRLSEFRYDFIEQVNGDNLPLFNLDFHATKDENYGLTSDNIFDYCKLIENAKQLHFYEGGFCCLADRFLPKDSKVDKYCHLYAKVKGAGTVAAQWCLQDRWHKNKWNYITEEQE